MRKMRSIFVITCLIIITAMVWAGIYTRKQGFTGSWRTAIERDLESRGYYANVGKLTLGVFRGLVAEDVVLFADASRETELAAINDVFVDVGLRRILSKNLTINTLEIQDGKLTIPVAEDETVEIKNLSARFALTENIIEVVRLKADLSGMDISVKGALFRAPNERSRSSTDTIDTVTQQTNPTVAFGKLTQLLERLEFDALNRPELEIFFKGDIRELENTQIIASLTGENIQETQSGYTIKELDVKAEFDGLNGRGEITNFQLNDEIGTLIANAKWIKAKKRIDVKVDSSADIKTLLSFFFPDKKWSEIVFFTPPRFRAEGAIDLGLLGKRPTDSKTPYFPGQVIGNFQTERFVVTSGVIFNSSRGDFSLAGESFYLRNVRADHKTGAAFLNCKYQPGNERESLKFQTEVKMDPRIFEPFFQQEDTKRFLQKWQFKENSGVYIRAAGQSTDLSFSDIEGRGVIALQDFKLNQVPFQALEATIDIDGQERWYRDVKFTREDGSINAKQVYTNTEKRFWTIEQGTSSINIKECIGAFSPTLEKWLSPYQFSQPPLLKVNGKIDNRPSDLVADGKRTTDVNIEFTSPGIFSYPFLGQMIPVNQPQGMLSIKQGKATLRSATGKLASGDLKLTVNTPIGQQTDLTFKTELNATKLEFNELLSIYGLDDLFQGPIGGELSITGKRYQLPSFNGSGKLNIEQADLLQLPTFKGLLRLIKRDGIIVKGQRINTDLTIKNGILTIDELILPGSFQGSLKLDLPNDQASIQLVPKANSGFQYQANGSIMNPQWETVPVKKISAVEPDLSQLNF